MSRKQFKITLPLNFITNILPLLENIRSGNSAFVFGTGGVEELIFGAGFYTRLIIDRLAKGLIKIFEALAGRQRGSIN